MYFYFKARDKHRLYNETHEEVKILIVATASYLQGGMFMNPLLSFKSVSKGFDDVQILDEIDLDIESGYFYTLLGPSGCGKQQY